VIHGLSGFDGRIHDTEVMQAVADAHDAGNLRLFSFLDNPKLLYRVVIY